MTFKIKLHIIKNLRLYNVIIHTELKGSDLKGERYPRKFYFQIKKNLM